MSQLTAEEFEERYHKAREHADGVQAVRVAAKVRQQCGRDILVARCPKCSTPMAVDGPGRQLCRVCHLWIEFVPDSK